MNQKEDTLHLFIAHLSILLLFLFTNGAFGQSSDESTALKESNSAAMQEEILRIEQAFQKMTETNGIAAAFKYYATPDAVIKRNEKLIKGQENIFNYYQQELFTHATVQWTPDFIDVSSAGDMAYSYGAYVWKIPNAQGILQEYTGVYFTVWKQQADGGWKYVWD